MRALAGTKETHPAQQSSVSNTAGREDDFLAGREIVRVVSLVRIGYAHRLEALDNLLGWRHFAFVHVQPVWIKNQTRLNLAIQTLDGRCGQDAFGRAADADARVNI